MRGIKGSSSCADRIREDLLDPPGRLEVQHGDVERLRRVVADPQEDGLPELDVVDLAVRLGEGPGIGLLSGLVIILDADQLGDQLTPERRLDVEVVQLLRARYFARCTSRWTTRPGAADRPPSAPGEILDRVTGPVAIRYAWPALSSVTMNSAELSIDFSIHPLPPAPSACSTAFRAVSWSVIGLPSWRTSRTPRTSFAEPAPISTA